ncbi:MAG TPA: ABC transporter permease, partial [Cyclobacteriaceae bacterium]|nr:ABC transporter permease [Cyclobacteriaceae bacterium]
MKNTNKISPPQLFLGFFRWFCHPELRDYIEGDLMELYHERCERKGIRYADLIFILDVFFLLRPGIIKPIKGNNHLIIYGMYKNYLIIGWRNILKNKAFSTINIFGVAIGLAACILILEFIVFEMSFDRFHSKLDRTYRITNDRFQNGKLIQHGTIMYPTIGPVMAKDFPEIEDYSRLMPAGDLNVIIDDRNFRSNRAHFVDERFFRVFDFRLLAGDRATLLSTPNTTVLTESTARKFFQYDGDDLSALLGKTFLWGLWGTDPRPFEVTGIIENIPVNSHIQFDVLVSYSTLLTFGQDADNNWTWSDMRHYLVLKHGADPKRLEAKFPGFSERYFQGDKVSGSIEKFYLQPLKDAHLYSDYEYDIAVTASGKAVWSMLVVAGFILVIAWINYINLTTSRAIDRAREVGLRKVMGAFKTQLIRQFILESVLTTIIAFMLAVAIVFLFQSIFNEIVGSNLSWKLLLTQMNTRQLLWSGVLLAGGAVLAGFYPAFILSSYKPVTVLKGQFTRSRAGNFFRRTLVVFQFTASTTLIAGTLIVSRQIDFMNSADLGINLKNIMVVKPPELSESDSTFYGRVEYFKHELARIPGVVNVTTSWRLPGDRLGRVFN